MAQGIKPVHVAMRSSVSSFPAGGEGEIQYWESDFEFVKEICTRLHTPLKVLVKKIF
jgi:hypothetical protein